MKEAWNEHTTKLALLGIGDKVFLPNQGGNNPRRWDRTGTMLECKLHDQNLVKVDEADWTSLRNRKLLQKYYDSPSCLKNWKMGHIRSTTGVQRN